jgi:hypothetical protein
MQEEAHLNTSDCRHPPGSASVYMNHVLHSRQRWLRWACNHAPSHLQNVLQQRSHEHNTTGPSEYQHVSKLHIRNADGCRSLVRTNKRKIALRPSQLMPHSGRQVNAALCVGRLPIAGRHDGGEHQGVA